MSTSVSLRVLLGAVIASSLGCGDAGGGAGSASAKASSAASAKPTATATASQSAAPASGDVDLTPLPLKAALAGASSKPLDDRQVVITNAELPEGINVSIPKEKTFDDVKKGIKAEKTIFTFSKMVEESATSAIAEVKAGGLMGGAEKTAFVTFVWKEIGGKPYLCKSSGLDGLKSLDDAKRFVKACDAVTAK